MATQWVAGACVLRGAECSMALIKVADAAESKSGECKVVEAAGKVLALFNVGRRF